MIYIKVRLRQIPDCTDTSDTDTSDLHQYRYRYYMTLLKKSVTLCCIAITTLIVKTVIGLRNVWSMKLGVPGQEIDQRKLGEILWKKTVRHVNLSGGMLWIIIDR